MLTFSLASKKSNRLASFSKILAVSVFTIVLSACNDDDNKAVVITPPPTPLPVEYSYEITVSNLTYAQPLSPIAVVLHGDTTLWSTGEEASIALEKLAESGDSADFLADSRALAALSGESVLLPGSMSTITLSTIDRLATNLTIATMLVNTNDAFSGLTGIDISSMAINASQSWNLNVYDAGTELNTEAMGTIPGPADGGIGFDAARDDVNFVAYHSGVVSQDDGLSTSVLTQAHRFDNPAIKLTIIRTK